MKSFTYQSCNNEAVLSVKKEFKQNPNDSSIKSKYESLIGDTYIAIERKRYMYNNTEIFSHVWHISSQRQTKIRKETEFSSQKILIKFLQLHFFY